MRRQVMARFAKWLARWRAELVGAAVVGMLTAAAAISANGAVVLQRMYCTQGVRCNSTSGCSQWTVCSAAGDSCGGFYSGTNLASCSSATFFPTCTVTPGGPYACLDVYQCVCSYDDGSGSWTCGKGSARIRTDGYTYNTCS
jgi:hypothetical protein